jgi:uncharacterized membrane protein (DUF2068 family)
VRNTVRDCALPWTCLWCLFVCVVVLSKNKHVRSFIGTQGASQIIKPANLTHPCCRVCALIQTRTNVSKLLAQVHLSTALAVQHVTVEQIAFMIENPACTACDKSKWQKCICYSFA